MGSLFKSPKAPEVKVQAPAVDNPTPEPAEVELGAQDTDEEKARRGKKGLRIDRNTSVGTTRSIRSGTNLV